MPHADRWPDVRRTRLHAHPQVYFTPVVRRAWVFDCDGCDQSIYLLDARPQPDGSLKCFACSTPEVRLGRDRLAWCPECQRSLPESEFDPRPWEPSTESEALGALMALLGGRCQERICHDCSRKPIALPTCVQCAREFRGKRSDARYCSGRCRVAHHRATKL